jgi:hypothetical protein
MSEEHLKTYENVEPHGHEHIQVGLEYEISDGNEQQDYTVWDVQSCFISPDHCEKHVILVPNAAWRPHCKKH